MIFGIGNSATTPAGCAARRRYTGGALLGYATTVTLVTYSRSTPAVRTASNARRARAEAVGEVRVAEPRQDGEKEHDEHAQSRGGAQCLKGADVIVEKRVDVSAEPERRFERGNRTEHVDHDGSRRPAQHHGDDRQQDCAGTRKEATLRRARLLQPAVQPVLLRRDQIIRRPRRKHPDFVS